MRKYLPLICLLAMWISGCSQEDVLKNQSTSAEGRVFTTSLESDGSRTYLEEGRLSRWTEGDLISLFEGNTLNRKYQFDGKTGDHSGTFSIVDKPFGTGAILSANYAIYPHASDMKISEKGVITTTLPAVQSYALNSFGLGDNTMVAVTKDTYDTFLHFKNVSGCFKLQLFGDDITVKSITLTGNNHEKLAGKASIMAAYNDVPTVLMTNNATESITLDCGEGVKIGQTPETATAFWMVVPPTTFEKGITVKVKDVDDKVYTQTTANKLEIKRNVIKPMTKSKLALDPHVTFTADAPQSLTMSKAVVSLEYSVNGNEWQELGTNPVLFGGTSGTLKLRGKSAIGTAGATIIFGTQVPVACSGDIRTLVDYENYENANTANATFNSLFENCTNLTSAPDLPAMNLAASCYKRMFYECVSLKKAPNLPATNLSDNCYEEMFYNCDYLTVAPELPATTLAYLCYSSMFKFSGLRTAPELPATTLAHGCYGEMFYGTQITTAPSKLPATTLTNHCYQSMFMNCRYLTNAPELPALKMTEWCYSSMFEGCENLTQAPNLPAPILAENCYNSMFWGCTNLTEAPELTASTLTRGCYIYMFYKCSKLNKITMLATNINAENCLFNWVYNVAATGTFTKSKYMSSLPTGINGIPSGWTVFSK